MKKNDKKEPKYIARNIYYGNKDFVECMKAVIRDELTNMESESLFNKHKEGK